MRILPLLTIALLACGKAGSTGDDDQNENGTDGGKNDGSNVTNAVAPSLASLEAHATGRDGVDLGLRISAADPDADIALVVVKFLESNGREAELFDGDYDGEPESGQKAFNFDVPVNGSIEIAGVVTLRRFLEKAAQVATLEVRLRDAHGLESNMLSVALVPQALKHLGEFCDPTYWTDRCDIGLGCRGEPTRCVEGVAPSIERVAYLSTNLGPRILVEGVDPDDDMKKVEIEFLDSRGEPTAIDLDNDESAESSSFTIAASGSSEGGEFFVELSPTDTFEAQVKQLAAVPVDMLDQRGDRRTARLGPPVVRGRAQSCDPRGFTVCATGLICDPGEVSAVNTCQPVAAERMAACNSAPILMQGSASIVGFANGSSVWDPPQDCAAHNPVGFSEGVAILSLPQGASRVVITTDLPGTTFDTVVYVLGACEDANAPVIACADDARLTAATRIVLTDVPAHDYLIVIDSYDPGGGVYELGVEVE